MSVHVSVCLSVCLLISVLPSLKDDADGETGVFLTCLVARHSACSLKQSFLSLSHPISLFLSLIDEVAREKS